MPYLNAKKKKHQENRKVQEGWLESHLWSVADRGARKKYLDLGDKMIVNRPKAPAEEPEAPKKPLKIAVSTKKERTRGIRNDTRKELTPLRNRRNTVEDMLEV